MSSNSYNLGRVVPIFKGDYGDQTQYNYLDVVLYDGGSYVCKEATIGHIPTDTNFWQLVASGSKITPEQIDQIVDQVMKEVGDKVVVDPEYVHTDNNLTDELLDRINDIPVVNDSIITIMQGEEVSGTFSLNQEGDATIHLKESIETVTWDKVEDKPEFANVAMSGDYNDLNSVPEIPVVNDATITIKQGEQSQSFKLNQEGDATIELEAGGQNAPIIVHMGGSKEENAKAHEDIVRIGADVAVVYSEINNNYFPVVRLELRHHPDEIEISMSIFDNLSLDMYSLWPDGTVVVTDYRRVAKDSDIKDSKITIKQGEKEQSFTLNQEGDATIELDAGGGSNTLTLTVGGDQETNRQTIAKIVKILSDGEPMPPVYVKFDDDNPTLYEATRIELANDELLVSILAEFEEQMRIFLLDGSTSSWITRHFASNYDIKDSKITIKQGEKEQSFTLNQEGDATIELDAGGSVTWDDVEGKPSIVVNGDESLEQWSADVMELGGGEYVGIMADGVEIGGTSVEISATEGVNIYSVDDEGQSGGIEIGLNGLAKISSRNKATGEYNSLGFEGEGLAKISANNIELESESLTWNEDTVATEGYVDEKIEAVLGSVNDALETI